MDSERPDETENDKYDHEQNLLSRFLNRNTNMSVQPKEPVESFKIRIGAIACLFVLFGLRL